MTGMHGRSKLAELESGDDLVRELVRGVLQDILEEEMTDALSAGKSERTSDRLGYCKRHLTTRVGKSELRVPQGRNGVFSTELFERYERSEKRPSGFAAANVSALMQMQVHGVSTRKVAKAAEALCGVDGGSDQCEAGRGADLGGSVSLFDLGCPLREGSRGRRRPGGRLRKPLAFGVKA